MIKLIRIAFLFAMSFFALNYGYIWLIKGQGGMKAWLSIIGTVSVLIELSFNLIDQLFGSKEKPKLQFEEIGISKGHSPSRPCLKSPKNEEGHYLGRQEEGIYEWDLNWSYKLVIRNNSNYHAFNPKIHLKKKFVGVTFPGMNNYKPDGIYLLKERYVFPINNLNEKEPIKSGEKSLIRINFTKVYQGTYNERDKELKNKIPNELEKFELLFELENGEGNTYFTLIKRKNNKWISKNYVYKPLRYLF